MRTVRPMYPLEAPSTASSVAGNLSGAVRGRQIRPHRRTVRDDGPGRPAADVLGAVKPGVLAGHESIAGHVVYLERREPGRRGFHVIEVGVIAPVAALDEYTYHRTHVLRRGRGRTDQDPGRPARTARRQRRRSRSWSTPAPATAHARRPGQLQPASRRPDLAGGRLSTPPVAVPCRGRPQRWRAEPPPQPGIAPSGGGSRAPRRPPRATAGARRPCA